MNGDAALPIRYSPALCALPRKSTVSKPPITLSSLDLDRIETLLAAIPSSVFPNKAQLQSELDRAEVLAPEQMPATVVTMNSTVKFSIAETGKEFCLTLVYPRDMDGSADRISIFAPVGSALLGLSVGDALAWPGPGGKSMTVHVTEIIYQPERSGELHR
jgi:regulator of nucleoside diphosphate kinase